MSLALVWGMSKHINVNPNFYKVGGRDHSEGPAEKQLGMQQQKGKGTRAVAGGLRGTSKKK